MLHDALIEDGAATLGTKVACDPVSGVIFVAGMGKSSNTYDLNNPCPPTIQRVRDCDAAAATLGSPKFTPRVGSVR